MSSVALGFVFSTSEFSEWGYSYLTIAHWESYPVKAILLWKYTTEIIHFWRIQNLNNTKTSLILNENINLIDGKDMH